MILQKLKEQPVYSEFNFKTQNIDKLAKWAFARNCRRISEKYSNIETTIKILNGLIVDFVRKADNIENRILATCKIDQTKFQKLYYENKINECQKLSQRLRQEIKVKKQKLQHKESQVTKLKNQLIKLKTQNIKLIISIEEIDKDERKYLKFSSKQSMIMTDKATTFRKISHKMSSTQYEKLMSVNSQVQHQLAKKIISSKQLTNDVNQIFTLLREGLTKKEKQSGEFGLSGSLFFKLTNPAIKKQTARKRTNDSKLLIYDILKNKYDKVMREKDKQKQNFNVSLESFMEFSPMQIMGLIELRGGVESIRWKQNSIDFLHQESAKNYRRSE